MERRRNHNTARNSFLTFVRVDVTAHCFATVLAAWCDATLWSTLNVLPFAVQSSPVIHHGHFFSQHIAMPVSVALSLEIEETWFYDTRTRYGSLVTILCCWRTSPRIGRKKVTICSWLTYFDVFGEKNKKNLHFLFSICPLLELELCSIIIPRTSVAISATVANHELFNESFRIVTWNCPRSPEIWEKEL